MPDIFVFVKCGERLVIGNSFAAAGADKTVKISVSERHVPISVYHENPDVDPIFGLIEFGEEITVYGRLKLTAYTDGTFGLVYRFKEEVLVGQTPDYSVSANFKNNRIDFSAYGKTRPKLVLSSGCENLIIYPKTDLTDLKLMFQPTKSAMLCVAKAKSRKNYMAVGSYDGVFRLLYEGEADEYVFSDDGFTETTRFKDLCGRVRKSFYTFTEKGFVPVKEEFSYDNFSSYDLNSSPSLLLEATTSGDFAAAEKYLGDELKGKAAFLPEFFGPFTGYERLSDGSYALYDDSVTFGFVKPKIVNFEVKNRLVDNISIKD